MRLRHSFELFLVLFLALLPVSALAQADLSDVLGIPPDAAIYPIPGLGFVNLRNGNLHIEQPIRTVKDRNGTSLSTSITYDSSTWHTVDVPGPNGTPVAQWTTAATAISFANFGMNLSFPLATGSVSYTGSGTFQCGNSTIPQYSGWQYVDPHGTVHAFPAALYTEKSGGTGCPDLPIAQAAATDGSGYWLEVSNYTLASVYDAHGNRMLGGADTNGNLVPSGVSDRLGRTVLLPSGFTTVDKKIYVWTAFGRGDYGPISATVLSTLTLPDGRSYSFQYDDAGPPAGANGTFLPSQQGHYGTLTGLTLPSGGHISISGEVNPSGGAGLGAIVTRQIVTPDGTWSFAYSAVPSTGGVSTVTATAPINPGTGLASQTTWLNGVTSIYPGAASGTPLRKVTISPDLGRPTTITTTLDNGQSSQSVFTYADACTPRVASKKEYDYSGSLIRETDATYLTSATDNTNLCKQLNAVPAWTSSYLQGNRHITDIASSVTVYGPTGCCSNPVSQTSYTYDSTALSTSSGSLAASVLGLATHDDTDFGSTMTLRGNPTVVSQMVSPGNFISTSTMTYNILGELIQSADAKNNITTFDYTDSWDDSSCISRPMFAYPTTVTNALGQSTKTTYNSCDGSMASVRDQNDLTAGRAGTVYTYDALQRLTNTSFPDGGSHSIDYGGSALPEIITTTTIATPSPNQIASAKLDTLGRTVRTTAANGAIVDTVYDPLGRVHSVSNPYLTTTDNTYGITTFAYDALGRSVQQTAPDNSSQKWSYTGNATTSTDEAGHSWLRNYDALGRLDNVTEPDGASTGYVYDPLNNLTIATQLGVAGATRRNHSFSYDSMSRLLSAANPETGTNIYTYDGNGNAISRTDARGIKTSYTYDVLNRLSEKSYSDGITPAALYVYDTNKITIGSQKATTSNVVGRLSVICVDIPGNCQSMTAYSYDSMGRQIQTLTSTPTSVVSGAVYTTSASYDLAGHVMSLTYPDARIVSQGWNSAGQLQSVTFDSWNGQSINYPYISSTAYWPNGDLRALFYGNNIASGYHENNRLQTDETSHLLLTNDARYMEKLYCFGVATTPIDSISPPCDAITSGNNGNVLQIKDVVNSANLQTFSYDSLNRITSATGPGYSQQYAIDSFGNMSMMVGTSAVSTFDPATNRTNNLPCASSLPTYDASGNQLCDSDPNGAFRKYGYDAESRTSQITMLGSTTPFESYLYYGDGNRVSKAGANGSLTEYIQFNGETIAERNSTGSWSDYIFANGQKIARSDTAVAPTNAQASTTFYHFGRLGSTEVLTDGNGTLLMSSSYLPFGQEMPTGATSNHYKFTGKERDTESGLDYFGARYYSSNMGRFSSPDPSGLYYADPANPQSLNLYSYAQNNPLSNVDPNGLDCVYFNNDGNGAESVDHNSNSGECGANGGDWVNGTTQMNQIQYNQASDNFTIRSSDASNSYNTIVNSPGSEQDGAACYGNCSVGYFASSNVDPLNSYAQGVIGGVAQRTGPLLHLGNCAAGALTVGAGSFLGYDPAPGSSDLVKTLREGAEAALVSKGGGASSQGAAAIALEVASAARGVSKPFAMAVGRAAGSAVEKAVPALLIAQAGLAASDAIDEFQSCYP